MAVIGEIAVNVVANIGRFVNNLTTAKAKTAEFGNSLSKFNSLIGVGLPLSLGAAATAVMRVASSLADLQDEADKLNASTGGLQSLQFIGTQVGTKFESLTMALGNMQVRLAEVADTGKGPAAEALRKLGLSAGVLINMKSDDAFSAIAEGISNIDNAAMRANISMDLFGKAGKEIVNTLKLGSDGIAKMRNEAERLGLIIREDTIKAAAEFDDSIQRIFMSAKAISAGPVGNIAHMINGLENPQNVSGRSPLKNPQLFGIPFVDDLIEHYNSTGIEAPGLTFWEHQNFAKEEYRAKLDPSMAVPNFITTFANNMGKQLRLGVRSFDSQISSGGAGWFKQLRNAEDWISKKNREMELRQWEFDNRKQVPGAGPVSVGLNRAIDYDSNEALAIINQRKNDDQMREYLKQIADAANEERRRKPVKIEVVGIQ